MTLYIVTSGNTDQVITLHSGDVMSVQSSGTSEQNLVSNGGRLLVDSGGESLGDTIFGGGLAVLSSGATASGLTISSGGVVSAAGLLIGTTTDIGLISGGAVVSQTAAGFGSMSVSNHGVAASVTDDASFVFVQSGGTTRNLLATNAAAVLVYAGGTTTGTRFAANGGTEFVYGSAQGTIISSGAIEQISAGGFSTSAVISSGGKQYVSSAGGASGTMISNGGAEFVTFSGIAQSSVIASGGNEYVQTGGLASAFTIASGGVLTVSAGGVLAVGSTGTGTNFGDIDVQATATLDLAGVLSNGGLVSLDAANVAEITAASATLTGSGVLSMANSTDLIFGAASSDTLDNESNLIEGAGQIGDGSLTVINRGVIDANLATALTLNATAFTNTGLIEATNANGGLFVSGAINNSGGVIEAKTGAVYLATAVVSGGVLSASGAGGEFYDAVQATLNGAGQALTNKAEVVVQDGASLTLDGAIDNLGDLSLQSTNNEANLIINGPMVTLTGSGTVLLSDNSDNRIYADATTNVLDNVDNTIEGTGTIGLGQLDLVNGGTIDATGTNGSLVIDTTSASNTGLIEATGPAGLLVVAEINNAGGVIAANHADVYLGDNATIDGGVLSSTPLAHIYVDTATGSATLNGAASALTNNADVYVDDVSKLDLVGAIINDGVISLHGNAGLTDFVVNGPSVTLTGGGTVELTDDGNNRIYGAAAADQLINVDNTIEGAGQLGAGQLTLVNRSTIDATGATNSLVLNAVTSNTGLIEATSGAGLTLESGVTNSGGVIAANGGDVYLEAGASVSGGLLSATAQGEFYVEGVGATFDGTASPLSNTATIFVEDASQLNLAGAIVNNGTISLNATTNVNLLVNAASAALTGSGTIELSDNGNNRIFGAAGADILDNETDTIEGAGQIGAGQLTLINRGTIDATGTNALVIATTSATNSGLMESTAPGDLVLESVISNAGGVIGAFGGDVEVEAGAAILGGALSGASGGDDQIQVLSGGAVRGASVGDDAVEIVASGALQSGVAVLSGGIEQVLTYATVSAGVVMSGGLEIMAADAVTSGVRVSAGGVLEGPGYLRGAATDAGLVSGVGVASGGALSVSSGGVASGVGLKSGGRVTVLAQGSAGGAVVSGGAAELISSGGTASGTKLLSGGLAYVYSGGLDNRGLVSSGGSEDLLAGGTAEYLTVSSGGVLTDNGEVRIGGAGTLAGRLVGSGAIVQTTAGVLLISGAGTSFSGRAVIDSGTIELGTTGALGSGYVQFAEPATGSAVLQIDAADAPAAGGTFANLISNFNGANEDIDLRSIAYVAGASASIVGSTLVLHDGGATYTFKIAGATAGAYPVLSDGHGGTLIDPRALAPKTVAFAQAAAAFAPSEAAKTALVSSTSPAGQTPFAHATASAGAGHG
jgi:autotransporter passenger strand-loop-strand repeat protein